MPINPSFQVSDFELVGAPPGTTIRAVGRISDTVAQVVVNFDGTDFDTNRNVALRAKASGTSENVDLTSGTVLLTAIQEVAPPPVTPPPTTATRANITSTNPSSLTESNLNGATVTVTLTGTTYVSSLSTSNFSVSGPSGLSIRSVSRSSGTVAVLTLNWTGNISSASSFTVTVASSGRVGSGGLTTGSRSVDVTSTSYRYSTFREVIGDLSSRSFSIPFVARSFVRLFVLDYHIFTGRDDTGSLSSDGRIFTITSTSRGVNSGWLVSDAPSLNSSNYYYASESGNNSSRSFSIPFVARFFTRFSSGIGSPGGGDDTGSLSSDGRIFTITSTSGGVNSAWVVLPSTNLN